jgi:outer membrane protein assembly factor BamB
VYGAPPVANGRVFVNTIGQNRFELVALDVRTGNPVWSAHDGSFDPPSTSGGDVLIAGQRAVLIVDQRSGQISARIPVTAEITTSPQRYWNLLVVGTIDGALHAVRAR